MEETNLMTGDNVTDPYILAIDLLFEDLHTKHSEIRIESMTLGCNQELDLIRDQVLEYLSVLRKNHEVI